MTESTSNTNPPIQSTPATPVRKKRKWLRWVGGLCLALVLLLALLPTIISMGFVRSIVVAQLNNHLDGKAEIADWSFGWFSSTHIGGVKLYDKQNILIFEADQIATQASILQLVRGNYALGDTPININLTKLQIHPDGSTNFHDVFHIDKTPKPKKPATGSSSIPNVSCNIQLKFRGTVEVLDDSGSLVSVVQLREGSGGTISIADINEGIKPDLKLIYDVDNRPQSTITISGNIDAVDQGKVDMDLLTANLKLVLQQVDLGAAQPFLALAGQGEAHVEGFLSGDLNVLADGQKHQSVKGAIQLSKIDATHPALNGDHYVADKGDISLDIDRSTDATGDRIKCKSLITLPQGNVDITGDVPVAAIINLRDKKAPGATGFLTISKNFNLSLLANEFRNTAHMIPGVVVSSGALSNKIEISIEPDKVVVKNHTDAVATGTNPQGAAIAIDPLTISADVSLIPAENPVKGLSDLAVVVAGKCINMKLAGASISKLSGSGDADLDRVRQQISQFVDLAQLELAGKAHFNFSTDGDLSTPGSQTNITANLTTEGLVMSLPKRPPLKFGNVTTSLSAAVVSGQSSPLEQIKTATLDFKAGDNAQSPLVDFSANISDFVLATKTIGQLNISKCSISSLKDAQTLIDPFVPALQQQGISVTEGQLYLVLTASVNGANQSIEFKQLAGSLPNVTVLRQGKPVLNREDFKFGVAGNVGNGTDGLQLNLSTLSVDSALVTVHKTDAPFTAHVKGAAITGSGQLDISAQLASLNRIAKAFMADNSDADVQSGIFSGTATLQGGNNQPSHLVFAGKVDQLTVALGNETPVQNEQFNITIDATTDQAMKNILATAAIKGSYLAASANEVNLNVGAGLLDMLQNAKIYIGVKDVAKAQLVARSLVPGIGNLPKLTSGGIAMILNVSRDTSAHTTRVDFDFGGSRVALAQGNNTFAFNPKEKISAKCTAVITGTTAIDRIELSDLLANLDVLTLSMPDKVIITNPTTDPTGTGTIEVAGSIQRIAPLLQVLQGSADSLPFTGVFKLRQAVGNSSGALTLKGSGTIDDFTVLDSQHKPTLTEKQVAINNDLSVNMKTQSASINAINLDMASSQAAKINVTGGIDDWTKQRVLRNVVVRFDGDGGKVWSILQPFIPASMADKLKDAKMYGPISIKLDANGPMPAGGSLADISAKALVKLDGIEGMGLFLRNFELPVTLRNGLLVTGDLDKPKAERFAKPAACNEGLLDLSSIVVDLHNTPATVSIGRRQKLLQKIKLNGLLAAQLGKYGGVLFANPKNATGWLDLTVMEYQNVPLGALTSGSPEAKGKILYSISDLRLDSDALQMLAKACNLGPRGLEGSIKEGQITIENGKATNDATFAINTEKGAAPMRMYGMIGLRDFKFSNTFVTLPLSLIDSDQLRKIAPAEGLKIPFGADGMPKLDKLISDNAGGILGGLLRDQLDKKDSKNNNRPHVK